LASIGSFSDDAVHRVVPLRFSGHDLKLKTSQGLFSSAHVDSGTLLLLKTLAQQKFLPDSGRVLDTGCGYGPLALAVKKSSPQLQVTARDRLALAVAFTAENARLNGLEIEAQTGLLLENDATPWDRIVCNLPAKAGEPVLADFVSRSLHLLTAAGKAAVVIVNPLADWFEKELTSREADILYKEDGEGYRVFHYSRRPASALKSLSEAFPEAYIRQSMTWEVGARVLTQDTVYGLPNFDAVDFRLEVSIPLLLAFSPRGRHLLWEPVQGHAAAWVDAALPRSADIVLAGNDTLALRAAARAVTHRQAQIVPAISLRDLVPLGPFGSGVIQLHPEPLVPWVDEFRGVLLNAAVPGAVFLINGRSTDLARFLERHKGFRVLKDLRSKGWRAVLLERGGSP